MNKEYTVDECLQAYYDSLEEQLAEKDAMLDWLAGRLSDLASWAYVEDRFTTPAEWRKAAQEAVKRNES